MRYTYMCFPQFRQKALTLSYDDGVVYDKRLIEIMTENGLKGTFNLNSSLLSDDGKVKLTKEQAYDLYTQSGNEVAIHGERHIPLTAAAPAIAANEILQDRLALEKLFGTTITGMAYAFGDYNDAVVEVLKNCGVEYARTVKTTESFDIPTDWLRLAPTCHHNNPRLMELAEKFISERPAFNKRRYWDQQPELFYLWGHSYEFNNDDNWYVIEEFSKYIGNRADVWYATNMEIYRYVKAFDSLIFSVDGELVSNPTCIDVYINCRGDEVVATAGKTVKIA